MPIGYWGDLDTWGLHGERWLHEPLRLTVIIDATQQAIERVMGQHAVVRHLLDNGWLHLWRFEGTRLLRYVDGDWHRLDLEGGVILYLPPTPG